MKIMASGPITSWEIDGETVETVPNFIFWGSKMTADGDCSHEIKRCLLLGRKVMTNIDSILRSRDITLPTNAFPSIRIFSNESVLRIRWPKYWSFKFSISPSNEYSGLISFRMDWLDLLLVHGFSRVSSNTTVQNHQFLGAQLSL